MPKFPAIVHVQLNLGIAIEPEEVMRKCLPLPFLFLGACMSFIAQADPTFIRLRTVLTSSSQEASAQSKSYTLGSTLQNLRKHPEFEALFKHYTLAKISQSLQFATPVAPRAILYGNTGKLIMTFNSDPSFDGGYALETAEFDESTNQIYFREILFKDEIPTDLKKRLGTQSLKSANEGTLYKETLLRHDDIEFENEKIAITKPNPEKCMLCHSLTLSNTRYARYIWSNYFVWPGIYGEVDDKLSSTEQNTLHQFKLKSEQHDRYSTLQGLRPVTSPYPYDINALKYGTLDLRSNLLLTEFISYRQAKEVASILVQNLSNEDKTRIVTDVRCGKKHGPEFDRLLETHFKGEHEVMTAFDRSSVHYLTLFGSILDALHAHFDLTNHTSSKSGLFGSGFPSLFASEEEYNEGESSSIGSVIHQELYRLLVSNAPETQSELNRVIEQNTDDGGLYDGKLLNRLNEETRDFFKSHIKLNKKSLATMECPNGKK